MYQKTDVLCTGSRTLCTNNPELRVVEFWLETEIVQVNNERPSGFKLLTVRVPLFGSGKIDV